MDIVTSAWLFATEKHVWDNKQKYAHIWPYTHHLLDVVNVLKRFHITEPEILSGAILHDVIEDTRDRHNEVKSRDITELFGERVGKIVSAVTSEPGENRKIRNALTYPKIREAGWEALVVKLADRIANVEFGIKNGGGALAMYRKEHADFRHGVYLECTNPDNHIQDQGMKMWHHLNGLIKIENGKHPGGDGK